MPNAGGQITDCSYISQTDIILYFVLEFLKYVSFLGIFRRFRNEICYTYISILWQTVIWSVQFQPQYVLYALLILVIPLIISLWQSIMNPPEFVLASHFLRSVLKLAYPGMVAQASSGSSHDSNIANISCRCITLITSLSVHSSLAFPPLFRLPNFKLYFWNMSLRLRIDRGRSIRKELLDKVSCV